MLLHKKPQGRLLCCFIVAALLAQTGTGKVAAEARQYQPKVVLTVEAYPARKMFGSLSAPHGSPWCEGKPTIWLVGHQEVDETPYCLDTPSYPVNSTTYVPEYSNGTKFIRPRHAILDTYDIMNGWTRKIDRHDCKAIDANHDGIVDVVCAVGADQGKGVGYTELYLTIAEPSTRNKLQKVPFGHGLQKYPTTRARLVKQLQSADGSQLLFVATRGELRLDNMTNVHRMYRSKNLTSEGTTATTATTAKAMAMSSTSFDEVPGPWTLAQTHVSCLIVGDLNGDGLDDIVICNQRQNPLIYLQSINATFTPLSTIGTKRWRQARMADVTGDGIVDLVTVGLGRSEFAPKLPSFIAIYKGSLTYPHFNWTKPYYERLLPFGTPDLEILDVNQDGSADIYVVQTDEMTPGTYCAGGSFDSRKWWKIGNQPPSNFVPPRDLAKDLLLVRNMDESAATMFTEIYMDHSEPGCGFFTELFGDKRTMILGQGTNNRPGHALLLQW